MSVVGLKDTLRPPGYIDAVEGLVEVPFYNDPGQAALLRQDPGELDPSGLDERGVLYTAALRILATEKTVGAGQARHAERVRFIGNQLLLINNAEQGDDHAPSPSPIRPYQGHIIETIVDFIRKRPPLDKRTETACRPDRSIEEICTKGGVVVAPTGSGKTVMMARAAVRLGIGRPRSETDPSRARLLIIASSRQLVEQLSGLSGDNTFGRFAPGIRVTPYYGAEKDKSGDVVVVTNETFVQSFNNGKLDGERFAVAFIDEAHHLTERKFLEVFHKHWRGPAIGFTATPAYHADKDVRSILPNVISRGNLAQYIKEGILNSAQLFSFVIEPRDASDQVGISIDSEEMRERIGRQFLDRAVVDFVSDMVRKGKRGMVFCAPGEHSKHARHIAKLLTQVYVPDGLGGRRPIAAEALGVFQGKRNKKIIDAYHAKEYDVLTSVGTGVEGFNADVDFVVIAAPTRSKLRLLQMIGRGTRPNPDHPVTVYAEFLLPPLEDEDPFISLWDAFDMRFVSQGYRVSSGRHLQDEREAKEDSINLDDLSPSLQAYARPYDKKMVSEITLAPGIELIVPEGHISLHALAAACERTELVVKRLLHGKFSYTCGWEENEEGDEVFGRFYPPEALPYLMENHKLAKRATADLFTLRGIAKSVGCSPHMATRIIAEENIKGVARANSKNREYIYYTKSQRDMVAAAIERMPSPLPADRTAEQLNKELGAGPHYISKCLQSLAIQPITKRDTQAKKTAPYLSREEAEKVRADFYSVPLAEAADMYMSELAKHVRISEATASITLLQEEERAAMKLKRPIHALGDVLAHLPGDIVLSIVQRSLPQNLPAHMMPLPYLSELFNATEKSIRKILKKWDHTPEVYRLPGRGAKAICYAWDAAMALDSYYGRRPGIPEIPYANLPFTDDDYTPRNVAIARSIHRRYVAPDRLVKVPTYGEVLAEIAQATAEKQEKRAEILAYGDRAEQWRRRAVNAAGAAACKPD
ncbi:MAG TPA: DEAD/DEAH box helicase family protein [Candidatus Saccharimonadales bacterium]|nr:DEAD/DEAH box helicase family protein [Candidatus Saccharimonadales bacterium]